MFHSVQEMEELGIENPFAKKYSELESHADALHRIFDADPDRWERAWEEQRWAFERKQKQRRVRLNLRRVLPKEVHVCVDADCCYIPF